MLSLVLVLSVAAEPQTFAVVNRCPPRAQSFAVVNKCAPAAPATFALPDVTPVEYVQVCEGGVCRLVPITAGGNAPQSVVMPTSFAPSYSSGPAFGSSCANGQCAPQPSYSRPGLFRR